MTTKDIDYLVKKGWSIHDTSKNRVKRSITPHALNYIKENLPSRDGVILDVGCSLGHTTRELAGIFQDHLVFGLDISEEIISKATEIEENEKYEHEIKWRTESLKELYPKKCDLNEHRKKFKTVKPISTGIIEIKKK